MNLNNLGTLAGVMTPFVAAAGDQGERGSAQASWPPHSLHGISRTQRGQHVPGDRALHGVDGIGGCGDAGSQHARQPISEIGR